MKVKDIYVREDKYVVTLEPNWLERLLGEVEEKREYKDTGYVFNLSKGSVYVGKDGKLLNSGDSIGKAIDAWRRSW